MYYFVKWLKKGSTLSLILIDPHCHRFSQSQKKPFSCYKRKNETCGESKVP